MNLQTYHNLIHPRRKMPRIKSPSFKNYQEKKNIQENLKIINQILRCNHKNKEMELNAKLLLHDVASSHTSAVFRDARMSAYLENRKFVNSKDISLALKIRGL